MASAFAGRVSTHPLWRLHPQYPDRVATLSAHATCTLSRVLGRAGRTSSRRRRWPRASRCARALARAFARWLPLPVPRPLLLPLPLILTLILPTPTPTPNPNQVASYLFGQNRPQQALPSGGGEKMSMTAPVRSPPCRDILSHIPYPKGRASRAAGDARDSPWNHGPFVSP